MCSIVFFRGNQGTFQVFMQYQTEYLKDLRYLKKIEFPKYILHTVLQETADKKSNQSQHQLHFQHSTYSEPPLSSHFYHFSL